MIDSIILLLRIGETNKAIELLKTLFDEKFYEGEDAIISSGYLLQRQIDQLIASETLPPVWKEAIPSKFRDISEKLRIIESYPGGVRTRHSYRRNNRFNGL